LSTDDTPTILSHGGHSFVTPPAPSRDAEVDPEGRPAMDRERFDALARLLATKGSRRATLGAVLGGFWLGETGVLAKDGRRKGKRRGKDRQNGRNTRRKQRVLQAEATGCCSGGRCLLRPGQNLFKCCFEDAELAGQNLKGANLGSANFAGAI
jgi:hypothetical protein